MDRLILVKDGPEISLKGGNRARFKGRLIRNIRRATGLAPARIREEAGRTYLEASDDEFDRTFGALRYVFGAHAFVPAYRVENDIKAIVDACLRVVKDAGVPVDSRIATFGVHTRRSQRGFPMTSREVNIRLGSLVLAEHPTLTVNLDNPDLLINVEIRRRGSFVYTVATQRMGEGGIPVGVSGRALAMMSGGIDSPVAAWMALRRGLDVDAVHFHSFPFTGEKSKEKCLNLMRVLSRWKTAPIIVYVPPFGDIQTSVAERAPQGVWTVMFRRMMTRVAERLMETHRYRALVTGDSLGQVASQTLDNLASIRAASRALTLQPLIGIAKDETIAIAKRIGTYDISIEPYEDCCTVFTPKSPNTKTAPDRLSAVEDRFPVWEMVEKSVAETEVYRVGRDGIEEITEDYDTSLGKPTPSGVGRRPNGVVGSESQS